MYLLMTPATLTKTLTHSNPADIVLYEQETHDGGATGSLPGKNITAMSNDLLLANVWAPSL